MGSAVELCAGEVVVPAGGSQEGFSMDSVSLWLLHAAAWEGEMKPCP